MFKCFPDREEIGTDGVRRAVWLFPEGSKRRRLWLWTSEGKFSASVRFEDEAGGRLGHDRSFTGVNHASIGIDPRRSTGATRVVVSVPPATTGAGAAVRMLCAPSPHTDAGDWIGRVLFDRLIAPSSGRSVGVRLDFEGRLERRAGMPRWWPRRSRWEVPKQLDWMIGAAALEEAGDPLAPAGDVHLSLIVPVHDADPAHLDALLASVLDQDADRCELIFSDDASSNPATRAWLAAHEGVARVTIVHSEQNRGIAETTNAGIHVARGAWVGFLDHDDVLCPFAVARIARALASRPRAKFLYTDEVITNEHLIPTGFFLKPDWDPVLLSGMNYVNHLSLYRRDRLLEIGLLEKSFDGSQDYELLLRYTHALADDEIVHLPYPAYAWRRGRKSYSVTHLERATRNARKAISRQWGGGGELEVTDSVAGQLHRPRFDLRRNAWPLVDVVIPNRDSFELISTVLRGLEEGTDYPDMRVFIVDNGTTDPRTLALYERMRDGKIPFRADIEVEPFNFARSINKGIARTDAEIVVLLNNDIEILEPNWLKELVSCFEYPNVGIVGAKLLYPDRTLQHAGVIAGFGGLAGHWYHGAPSDHAGHMGRLWVRQSMTVVTAACMAISRECLERVGAFDAERFAVAYNDVDFCLRAHAAGFRTVWTPFATLVHHESASRGSDETPANIERFRREQDALRTRHGTDVFQDPAINPWYSRTHSHPFPVYLPQLPVAR